MCAVLNNLQILTILTTLSPFVSVRVLIQLRTEITNYDLLSFHYIQTKFIDSKPFPNTYNIIIEVNCSFFS